MTKFTVLNTRPKNLLKITHEAFAKQGFEVIDFPCIEIVGGKDTESIIEQLNNISFKDVVIFTSQHAVHFAFKLDHNFKLGKDNTVIAVGRKTAEVLEQNYSGHIWLPEQHNSEGVIDLIQGLSDCTSIQLITAANGRDLIQTYAMKQLIALEQINVYVRVLPKIHHQLIASILDKENLIILATSITTFEHLKILFAESWQNISQHMVLCASSRIEQTAQKLGFSHTLNSETANPEKMAQVLKIRVSKHN